MNCKNNILFVGLTVFLGVCISCNGSNQLLIHETYEYDWVWDDVKSGADDDSIYAKPKIEDGQVFLSFVNVNNWQELSSIPSTILKDYPSYAVSDPLRLEEVWNDGGSGGEYALYIYKAIPQSGYTCFGNFVSQDELSETPSSSVYSGFKCIHDDFVDMNNDVVIENSWTDSGSDADDDVGIWRIKNTDDMYSTTIFPKIYYVANNDYDDYDSPPYYRLKYDEIYTPAPTPSPIVSGLVVRETNKYDWVWDDSGSGADSDSIYCKPKIYDNEVFLSFINGNNWEDFSYLVSTVLTDYPSLAVSDPLKLEEIWNDGGSGGDYDLHIYKAIPQSGYTCLGDFVSQDELSETPSSSVYNGFKCIHDDFVEINNDITIENSWTDRGSGADDDVGIWRIKNTDDMYSTSIFPKVYYVANNDYDNAPSYSFYKLKSDQISTPYYDGISQMAMKFAPVLAFDDNAEGYPISFSNGENGWEQNNNLDIISNPIYYIEDKCSTDTIYKIIYHIYYGYQAPCINDGGLLPDNGEHGDDWETVIVHVSKDTNKLVSVVYHQHGGHYTADIDSIELYNQQPVAYIGQLSHGSYHDDNDFNYLDLGSCGYFYDLRDPSHKNNDYLFTNFNLINLDINNVDDQGNEPSECGDNDGTDGCDETGCEWEDCESDWDKIINVDDCLV